MEGSDKVIIGEVIDQADEIAHLRAKLAELEGRQNMTGSLTRLVDNPNANILKDLTDSFQLTSQQTKRLRRVATSGITYGAQEALGDAIGDVPAGLIGLIVGGWLANRILK